MLRLISLAVLLCSPALAHAPIQDGASACRPAIAAAEAGTTIPSRLLSAIAMVESGRKDPGSGRVVPWPWTINVEGVGHFYETKAEVIAAVLGFQARGARSIDVGCMQVNLLAHPHAFASLDDAFDPATNARYGALFLTRLYQQTGSWPRATAGYHSLTPEIGDEYARRVLAVWPRERDATIEPSLVTDVRVPPMRPLPFAAFGSSGSAGRLMLLPVVAGGPNGAPVGRSLDAYRAMPTRYLVPMALSRRF